MTPRQLALVLMVVLAVLGGGDAWAVTTSLQTAELSSVSQTSVIVNSNTSPATVIVSATDVNFLVPAGSVFGHYFAEAQFLIGSGSVVLEGFVDTTNTEFGTEILIGTANESTSPFIGPFVPLNLSGPYALTLIAKFTLDPGETLSYTHTVSVFSEIPAVPEPASAAVLVAGLILVGAARRWRRRDRRSLSPDR